MLKTHISAFMMNWNKALLLVKTNHVTLNIQTPAKYSVSLSDLSGPLKQLYLWVTVTQKVTSYAITCVTRFGENFQFGNISKVFGHFLRVNLVFGKMSNIPILGTLWCYCSKFQCKWPNIEQIMAGYLVTGPNILQRKFYAMLTLKVIWLDAQNYQQIKSALKLPSAA